ncbi:MAG: DUF5671 domain-containing protein [Patescibacteria group bacterium]
MDENILPLGHRPTGEAKRNIPRDLFLHLLAIVTLYWSSITFVTLLWQFINYFLPDVLTDIYMYQAKFELMRFAVSSLFIVFPLFILVSWFLNKIYRKEAIVRESKIRKWLLYFTLFVAALIVVGDLVSVINSLLGGETTLKFILKAFSVLLVAGFVFGYYLDDVRRETPTKLAKPFAFGASVLVLFAIIGSFFIIGSPATARLIQFDRQKISDLQNVQYQIVNYWQKKEALPNTLSDLNDPISGFIVPKDPQSNTNYEYNIKDAVNLSFELCATFNKEGNNQYSQTRAMSVPVPVKGFAVDNWNHADGKICFERTIDKQLYPPLNKTK